MSFQWSVLFREGSWLDFRNFALNQRKNVQARFDTINHELERIGRVSVLYKRQDENDSFSRMTERRIGIRIKTNSSLSKLLRAYVAQGGNYYDISMFLKPDSYEEVEDDEGNVRRKEFQPYSGVIAPASGDVISDKIDLTGVTDVWKDPVRKLGDKGSIWEEDSTKLVGDRVLAMQGWISQEIKQLRNDLEARIIKLCDLREQLLLEKDEIILSAVGGSVANTEFNPEATLEDLHVSMIVYAFDTDFYEVKEDGTPDFTKPRSGRGVKEFLNLLEDAPTGEEKYTTL